MLLKASQKYRVKFDRRLLFTVILSILGDNLINVTKVVIIYNYTFIISIKIRLEIFIPSAVIRKYRLEFSTFLVSINVFIFSKQ